MPKKSGYNEEVAALPEPKKKSKAKTGDDREEMKKGGKETKEKLANKEVGDDVGSTMLVGLSKIQFKLLGIMAVLFMFLSSDVFVTRILGKFSNAADGCNVSNYGTILQATFLVLGVMVGDLLISNNII